MAAISERLYAGWQSSLRLGKTARVLTRAGLEWLLGDRRPAPEVMRRTFERLGATYIKLGQFIASTPSLFPPEYVRAFEGCLDDVPPLPYERIRKTLEKSFDRPLDEIYSWIDPQPLASASIAQVHAARLVSGEDVVIKVQKPGVRNVLLTDLNFLYVTARVLELLAPRLVHASLSDIVSEIQTTMLEECDFLKEAANIETFDRFLRETDNRHAVVPKVHHQATTLKVLTMERFYGVALTDLEAIRRYSRNPAETLANALNTWISSLMFCQFFHADVHAGNLMVLRDGKIGFIDFGIVGTLQRETWEGLVSFMEGRALESYRSMAEAMVRIGATNRDVDIDQLAADLRGVMNRIEQVDATMMQGGVDNAELDHLMLQIVELGKQHGIRFPREFALLLKQLLYFDRYISLLAPDMDLFDDPRIRLH